MPRFINADQLTINIDHDISVQDLDDAMRLIKLIKDQPVAEITCFKCHGIGTYKIPVYREDTWELSEMSEECICEMCHGTGKISVDFYEELQEKMRKD